MKLRRSIIVAVFFAFVLFACSSALQVETPAAAPTNTAFATAIFTPTATFTPTVTPRSLVPNFEHIVIVIFENKEFGTVFANTENPYFKQLAKSYTLLTQHYAVTHPSLPNYLALIGGDTFGVTFDCTACIVDAPSLPDLIEASGRTWKTYQEDMPSPCFPGPEKDNYAIKHNPFMYFKPIRLSKDRCTNDIVPFTQLSTDIAAGALPNFMFITPNLCNDAHDCPLSTADAWLRNFMGQITPALEKDGQPYLVIVTWDEGQGDHTCCGIPEPAGGRVATILVSPQVQSGFNDDTPYNHYSILKTIEESWHLDYLGHSADDNTPLITAPWK
jgi:hypothetical protein